MHIGSFFQTQKWGRWQVKSLHITPDISLIVFKHASLHRIHNITIIGCPRILEPNPKQLSITTVELVIIS